MKISKFNHEGYHDPTPYLAFQNIPDPAKEAKKEQQRRDRLARYRPLVYICSPYAGDTRTNIANARRFDVEKDIFLSYTLDSRNESANDQDGPKHDQKYFFVGMFNSLTGALVSQGQLHMTNYGAFAVFGHRVNTEAQAGLGGGKLDVNTGNASSHDVHQLMRQVRKKVYENSGIALEPEMIILPPDYRLEDKGPAVPLHFVSSPGSREDGQEQSGS